MFYAGESPAEALAAPAGDQRRYYAGLRDAIRNGAPPPVSDAQALAVMAVLEAGIESAKSGKSVALPLDDEEKASFTRAE